MQVEYLRGACFDLDGAHCTVTCEEIAPTVERLLEVLRLSGTA
jgi:hypothetical protein